MLRIIRVAKETPKEDEGKGGRGREQKFQFFDRRGRREALQELQRPASSQTQNSNEVCTFRKLRTRQHEDCCNINKDRLIPSSLLDARLKYYI